MIKDNKFDFYILFNPMGVCWLLNIRAMDLKHTQFLDFCIISKFGEVFVFTKISLKKFFKYKQKYLF